MRNDLLLVMVAVTAALGLMQAKQSSNSQPQSPQASSRVYFLEDPMWTPYRDDSNVGDAFKLGAERRWCGYASESELEAGVGNLRPMKTGSVEYRGNVISAIHLDQADESGDWEASDDYTLDTQGQVLTLHRKFTLIPGDISVDETWSVRDGKATLAKRVTRHNNNVMKYPSDLAVGHLPRFTNLTEFRFEDFFRRYRGEILSGGEVCEKEAP